MAFKGLTKEEESVKETEKKISREVRGDPARSASPEPRGEENSGCQGCPGAPDIFPPQISTPVRILTVLNTPDEIDLLQEDFLYYLSQKKILYFPNVLICIPYGPI